MQNPAWLDTNEYPFVPYYFEVNETYLHYIDEGKGDTILFVHGTPSWSFDFRHQIKALSQSYRCIAIDHIGFGLSGKPTTYDYSTIHHAETLCAFIQHLGLENITLVVHDFGGVIGLHYALQFPDNVQKIVVLNSWLWSAEEETSYKKLKPILKSPLLPALYKWFNFSPAYLLPQSFANKSKLSKQIRKQYTAPFAKISERKGTLAFAKSLLYDQAWFESLWQQITKLQDKPVLFIWGMKDKFVIPAYLEKFRTAFKYQQVVMLPHCGHFPQEEEAEAVTKAIDFFLK